MHNVDKVKLNLITETCFGVLFIIPHTHACTQNESTTYTPIKDREYSHMLTRSDENISSNKQLSLCVSI